MTTFAKDVQKAFGHQLALQKVILKKMTDKVVSATSVKLPKSGINLFRRNKLIGMSFGM